MPMTPDELAAVETALDNLRAAGLRDPLVQRDRWQEARLGADLHFHAAGPFNRGDAVPLTARWSAVYQRWSQLYQRSRDLGLTR